MLTYQGERVDAQVIKLAADLGDAPVYECDVTSDATLGALAANAGGLDAFARAIAFVNKEDLTGKVYDTSYSLIALASALRENFNAGPSITALTYYGAAAIVPNDDIARIAKAALESIVRYLAFELGERGIRVDAIWAGPIKTASSRQVAGFSRTLGKVAAAAPCAATSPRAISRTAPYFSALLSRPPSPRTFTSPMPVTT